LTDDYDREDAAFISSDIPLDASHEWADRTEIIVYTVQEGDTISQLSHDFHLTSSTLRWVNGLSTNVLRIGQKLVVPPGDGYVYTVNAGDTIESITKKYAVTTEIVRKNNPHISDGVKPGILLYLPGLKPPVTVSQNTDNKA
jgi:LysM repeat protein